MCVGVPMRIIEAGRGFAICEAGDDTQRVDMQLVGDQPAGTWVLTFLGTAREVLTEEAATRTRNAIEALALVMRGETDVDHLFADLVDREIVPPPSMPRARRGGD